MDIKLLVEYLEKELNEKWQEYIELNKKLDGFRGKELTDGDVPEVNEIIVCLQNLYLEMYPALHWVGAKHSSVISICQGHASFIDSIKQAGAEEVKAQS